MHAMWLCNKQRLWFCMCPRFFAVAHVTAISAILSSEVLTMLLPRCQAEQRHFTVHVTIDTVRFDLRQKAGNR